MNFNAYLFRATVYIAISSVCEEDGYYQKVYVHNIIPEKLTNLGWEGKKGTEDGKGRKKRNPKILKYFFGIK